MSKLSKLTKWLSVEAAAKHISKFFGEPFTEVDVLRLALDGHLVLSVHLVNGAHARPCFQNEDGSFDYLPFVTTIYGIWDLPMQQSEKNSVENRYQKLTGGPCVTPVSAMPVFVADENGKRMALQEAMRNDFSQSLAFAQMRNIRENEVDQYDSVDKQRSIFINHIEKHLDYLNKLDTKESLTDYYHSTSLPSDSVFVVRTNALINFENTLSSKDEVTEMPLGTKERTTLLTVIAALCDYSAIDFRKTGVAGQIARMTEEIGATITDETILKILKKIPEALESRMK